VTLTYSYRSIGQPAVPRYSEPTTGSIFALARSYSYVPSHRPLPSRCHPAGPAGRVISYALISRHHRSIYADPPFRLLCTHRGQQPILARSIDETGICCQMDKFCCCRLNRSIDPPG
jgi:hypothetical protein